MKFDQSDPFPSLGQLLLSVLPPQSATLLPKPLGELMTRPSQEVKVFVMYLKEKMGRLKQFTHPWQRFHADQVEIEEMVVVVVAVEEEVVAEDEAEGGEEVEVEAEEE
mmetsp:Transcript_19538/g.22141  ORF Transcript_19538/g.22141 Transcript_19538/m.22141 type:complete len:108 (-) Transcript_19538:76-399(-)